MSHLPRTNPPPQRRKRAASGVAGLCSGSGQLSAKHALMSQPTTAEQLPEAIPLNVELIGTKSFKHLRSAGIQTGPGCSREGLNQE